MTTALKTSALIFVFAAACTAAGCGDGNAELSLAGPSAGASTSTGGATITGRVNGGSGLAQTTSSLTPSSLAGLTVTVAGTSISSQVDSLGRFTLNGVPAGPIELQFSGPGTNAKVTITVTGSEQVQIAVTVTAGSAHVESQHHSSANRAEVEGGITATDAAAQTLRVAGTLVHVPAEATIRRGDRSLQFADLMVGDMVDVRGTLDGTTLRASEVKVKSENHGHLTEREGTVSEMSGTCPALTFNIGLTRVTTNGSTFFKEGSCASVQNGASVEVKGRSQAGNALLAVQVELEDGDDEDEDDGDDDDGDDDDDNEADVEGSVSELTGTCPAIGFLLRTTTRVTTTTATQFDDGCSAVQNGARVRVKGMRQADGSIAATRVKLDN